MAHDRLELTRRKVLASIGVVGASGAGLGVGTTAYMSDEDTFGNNTVTAGELDLKVDWEEHYSYPQIYSEDGKDGEFGDPTVDDNGDELRVTRSDPMDSGYVGLPDPTDPVIWVHEDDLATYMDNTAIEAYPDTTDNDGVQDPPSGWKDPESSNYVCNTGADLEGDLDPGGPRTDNADTRLENDDPAPLIDLRDIKPGDFGELTLSFHLCDNPGFVWLRAANIVEEENGIFGNRDAFANNGDRGELGRKANALVWYDRGQDGWDGDEKEGDNVRQDIDNENVIEKGSLREVLDELSSDRGVLLEGNIPAEEGGGTGPDCFDNSTTYYIGFAWWLPMDVDNEVASDTISFDLGFYAEQCRHNDGGDTPTPGTPETPTPTPTETPTPTPTETPVPGPEISFIAYCGPKVDSSTTVNHEILESNSYGPTKVRWESEDQEDQVETIRTRSGQLEEEFSVDSPKTSGVVERRKGTEELEVNDNGEFSSNPCGWDRTGTVTGVKYEYEYDSDSDTGEFVKQ